MRVYDLTYTLMLVGVEYVALWTVTQVTPHCILTLV